MTTTTIDDIHPDILSGAFRHMDGPTLAAASCSSPLFRYLSSDPTIWRQVCISTWPSLRHLPTFPSLSPRSFFSDSFPFPDTEQIVPPAPRAPPKSLYSCIDIFHAGVPVFSRVIETDTSSSWFLNSVFRIDALDRKDPPETERMTPPSAITSLELSWVLVNPDTGRAVNVSSRLPVEVGQHWYSGETLVKFVTVLDRCAVSIVVTWTGQVREVSMTVEDWDGIAVTGKDSLVIMEAAMEGRRRRGIGKKDEAKGRYEEYARSKNLRKEMKAKREGMLDLCCTGFGAVVFLAFLMLLAFRR